VIEKQHERNSRRLNLFKVRLNKAAEQRHLNAIKYATTYEEKLVEEK